MALHLHSLIGRVHVAKVALGLHKVFRFWSGFMCGYMPFFEMQSKAILGQLLGKCFHLVPLAICVFLSCKSDDGW